MGDLFDQLMQNAKKAEDENEKLEKERSDLLKENVRLAKEISALKENKKES